MKINTKNEDTKNVIYKEIFSIPLFIIMLPLFLLAIGIYSFNVYAVSVNYNNELLGYSTKDNNNYNNIEKKEVKYKIVEKTEEIPIDIQDNQELEYNNTEEIIEDTQEDVETNVYTATNGEEYSIIATLNIPSLGINYPILSDTSKSLLKISLNKYWGANPNEVGNMVVVGHNYENTTHFSRLPEIENGDIIEITDLTGTTLKYTVYDTDVIDPYDNSCTSQLTDGHTEITLITCYNGGKERFVAKARAK